MGESLEPAEQNLEMVIVCEGVLGVCCWVLCVLVVCWWCVWVLVLCCFLVFCFVFVFHN